MGRPIIRNVSSNSLDTYVNNILNENNNDVQGSTSFSYDISGNLNDPLIIIRLLTELNNNTNYS